MLGVMKRVVIAIVLLQGLARADPQRDAQNQGDFAAYAALYDAKFVGIRRTSDGGEKKMKWKAWKADRKKMFKGKQEVAADDVKVKAIDGGALWK